MCRVSRCASERITSAGSGTSYCGCAIIASTSPARTALARDFEVSAHDRESLLVDWLNEILFVAETGLWIPLEIEVLEASNTRIRARARGMTVEVSPSMVKAATFHGLEVVETADGLSAEVILDV